MIKISNNAGSKLAAGILATDLALTVSAGEGAKFPVIAAGEYFYATLVGGVNIEIVKVTARVGDVFTIERAQDGSTAYPFALNDKIEQRWNKAQVEERIADSVDPKVLAIGNGVGVISVSFATPKTSINYAVKFSFECSDSQPIFLMGMIQNKTVNGFDILLNAPTDSANYKLNYTVGNST